MQEEQACLLHEVLPAKRATIYLDSHALLGMKKGVLKKCSRHVPIVKEMRRFRNNPFVSRKSSYSRNFSFAFTINRNMSTFLKHLSSYSNSKCDTASI